MSFKSRVNGIRRNIMRSLTKNIGYSNNSRQIDWNNETFKRILISRPNSRLGNQLLITPLVEEITDIFPNCKIDLFVRGGLAPILYENYRNIDKIIKLPKKPFKELLAYIKVWISLREYNYDIVINVDENSSSGRLSTQFTRSNFKFFNNANEDLKTQYLDYNHIAKFPVYNFRDFLSKLGLKIEDKPIPALDIKLSLSEINNGKRILDSIVDCNRKTISLYTFATGAKCYTEAWWAEKYETIKDKYENEYNIIEILPIENVSQIGFKATSFYSKDIREIASLIANTEIFIGADSGIMHLASASKTPTIGLFSTTNAQIYEPYSNNSLSVNTNYSTTDDLIKEIDQILDRKGKRVLSYAM